MIIRSIGARHGSQAWLGPIARSCRHLSTDLTTPSSSADTNDAAALQPGVPNAALPRVFSKAAKAAQARRIAAENKYTVEKWQSAREVARLTQQIGSAVERRHKPELFVADPPAATEITLEMLMANQTHMGHHRSLWNPANARYIYGVRDDTHIISLEETLAHLRRAAKVVEAVAHAGGLVLFVGTRPGHTTLVTKAAQLAGGCHLFTKWLPGTITNRDVLLADAAVKVVDEHDAIIEGFDGLLQQRRPLVPDLVVCLNPVENYVMLYECGLENIPTIGVIDTNADPTWVTYPIPANDDSLRSVGLVAGALGRAGQIGRERRLAEAKSGNVTWKTPPDVSRFMKAAAKSDKKRPARRGASQAPTAEAGDAQLLGAVAEKVDGMEAGQAGAPAEAAESLEAENIAGVTGEGIGTQTNAPPELKPEV